MEHIKLSYQTNMWGLKVPFPKLNHWKEWYQGDFGNSVYYLDWDQILKYHVGAGFTGVELMFHMKPYIEQFFETGENFAAFARERGIEEITATFAIAMDSHRPECYEKTMNHLLSMAEFTKKLGGHRMTVMPCSGYFGNGPLSAEQLKHAAGLMNEFGKHCSQMDIIPCVHSEFWCAINKYDLERYIELLDHKVTGFCLDTAQVGILGFDVVDFYDKYHDFVKFFHLKDTNRLGAEDEMRFCAGAEFQDSGDRWFWELGAGDIDFKGLWKLLKKYRYEGFMSLETDGTPDPMATMLLSKYYISRELFPIYQ
ncbi:Inosose dehydratase [uncultured Roseburia sp.]|uniref:Sugar phosphate isomerase/epimerase n=1 Tax=Brotonthovivens ammoniilytica TaxID=2981725 RepID=A0ABT2TN44_9FIRM|nr:sugar phosphate isomerase/epimerase [Brotonthovivens ammoniilytica]MCU6763645.1 sugar phosphate isomerase/epimerase [Brotonthovivens ammoniilytica]SCJ29238.1 Inosose dehydratase [uncultured Roseburia sp.]